MSGTRRAMLLGLGGAGLMLAATPVLAAEQTQAPATGWAGVTLAVTGEVARIAELDPLGPAARAGLRPGDVVVGCNGGGLDRLATVLAGAPGERVELAVRRGSAQRSVRLVLEAQDSARP